MAGLSEEAEAFVRWRGLKDVRQVGPRALHISPADYHTLVDGLIVVGGVDPHTIKWTNAMGFEIRAFDSVAGTGHTRDDQCTEGRD